MWQCTQSEVVKGAVQQFSDFRLLSVGSYSLPPLEYGTENRFLIRALVFFLQMKNILQHVAPPPGPALATLNSYTVFRVMWLSRVCDVQ